MLNTPSVLIYERWRFTSSRVLLKKIYFYFYDKVATWLMFFTCWIFFVNFGICINITTFGFVNNVIGFRHRQFLKDIDSALIKICYNSQLRYKFVHHYNVMLNIWIRKQNKKKSLKKMKKLKRSKKVKT